MKLTVTNYEGPALPQAPSEMFLQATKTRARAIVDGSPRPLTLTDAWNLCELLDCVAGKVFNVDEQLVTKAKCALVRYLRTVSNDACHALVSGSPAGAEMYQIACERRYSNS